MIFLFTFKIKETKPMAHEMTELDSAMYGSDRPAWHGLGTVVAGQPNAKEALKFSGLDWEVITEAAYFNTGSGFAPVPGHSCALRPRCGRIPTGGRGVLDPLPERPLPRRRPRKSARAPSR